MSATNTAIMRWALVGIPLEVAMKASGHRDLAGHYRYVNLREEHVKAVFTQKIPTLCTHAVDSAASALLSS